MSYFEGLDEFSTMELLRELKRRQHLRDKGLCDYCQKPMTSALCRFSTRHMGDTGTRKLAQLGEIDVDLDDGCRD